MSKKISLNPKYTNTSGYSWSTTTYNNLKYHISTNKNSNSVSTLKCEFTTPYDNIDVVIEIGSSSENNYDWCYVGKLDDFNPSYNSNYLDRVSGLINNAPKFKTITINVAKAGFHFLLIGYRKDGSGNVGNDCGYFRLVTTEVDSLKPDPYIYCGTKTVVSEEPIKFTKKNVSNGGNGVRNWMDYQGTSKDYLWEANIGDDNSLKTAKISFTTSNDNVTVILKYSISLYGGIFSVSNLDSNENNSMIYKRGDGVYETITKEITVQKAGEHFIWICYDEGSFGASIYVGFFGTNVVTNTRTLVPESILANNRDIDKVYVGSELIWSKPLHNTISWETLTWNKSNNSYTYNTKDRLTLYYVKTGYNDGTYAYLLDSPASTPNDNKIKSVIFSGSYSGNTYNFTYKLDLSDWDTSNVTNMASMFSNCYALTNLDVSGFNTSNVTDMSRMFYNCNSLTYLDVSKFDTSNVTDMSFMFESCNSKSLDLSNFNTDNVVDITGMFKSCTSLERLNLVGLNLKKCYNYPSWLFYNCSTLTTLIDGHESEPDVTVLNGLRYGAIGLNYIPNINYESVYAVFRGVGIADGSQSIYLPKVMQGKLDATKVKIATDKGWTIKYS